MPISIQLFPTMTNAPIMMLIITITITIIIISNPWLACLVSEAPGPNHGP